MANLKNSTRRKFLHWGGLGSVAVFTGLLFSKILPGTKKSAPSETGESKTVKMLTEDGKLVEVAVGDLGCANRKMINDDDLKNWVKHK